MDSIISTLFYFLTKYKSVIDLILFISSSSVILFFILQYFFNKIERREDLRREFAYKVEIDPHIEILNQYLNLLFIDIKKLEAVKNESDIIIPLNRFHDFKANLHNIQNELMLFFFSSESTRIGFRRFLQIEDSISYKLFNGSTKENLIDLFLSEKKLLIDSVGKKLIIKQFKYKSYIFGSVILLFLGFFWFFFNINRYEILFHKSGINYTEIQDIHEYEPVSIDVNEIKDIKLFNPVIDSVGKSDKRIITKNKIKYIYLDQYGYSKDTVFVFYVENKKIYKSLKDIK